MELVQMVSITIDQAKNLLYGPYGLVANVENFGPFGAEVTYMGGPGNYSLWGLTQPEGDSFVVPYLGSIGTSYTQPMVQNWINQNLTGLFIYQSVDYWLWHCQDPIVSFLLGPAMASCALQNNNTVQPPSATWTGKNDLTKIGQYVMWRNQTQVDYWASPVPVFGNTDGGQFSPYMAQNQTLYVWDESFIKTVSFHQQGTASVANINTYVFVMDESAFAASALYTNAITGFANETASNQGVPIYLSNWDFYGVNSSYVNYTTMNPSVTDLTTLYVEPTTGSTIQANMKLQVNLYYQNNTAFKLDVFNFANIPGELFYPMAKIWQQSSIGDGDAKKLRDLLLFTNPTVTAGVLWGLVSLGSLLAVVGVVLLARGVQKKKRHGYATIQGE